MISILTQERLLGVALGAAFTASVVLGNRRAIHRSISDNRPVYYEPKEHMLGKKVSSEFAQMWNKAVDGTLGQLIIYLSSRGW
ncbi:hypothetical protein OPV22_002606 [Ensete ventricosum]|uniref:Uncharacterized protein n=1 Tax=Ensete ventricosum TaxID=4639 RepID=A0AAV8RY98_ENSVE|nr:hypothetical protein OPV22_002606 [Ensete ventricosum]